MKKHKMVISSSDKKILEQFQAWLVNNGEQQCLILDSAGETPYYPTIEHNKSNLNVSIECDFEYLAEIV